MAQQLILQPLGLVTSPNKVGALPPGSMSLARRAVMRAPGTIEAAFLWTSLATVADSQTAFFSRFGAQYLVVIRIAVGGATSQWLFINRTTGATAFLGTLAASATLDTLGRVSLVEMRSRLLFSTAFDVRVFDYQLPANTTEATPRPTVLSTCAVRDASAVNTGSAIGAIPAMKSVHYAAIVRRKFADGYEIVSGPGYARSCYNSHATQGANGSINVFVNTLYIRSTDYIELYRTRSQAWTDTVATNTGSDYYLCKSITGFTVATSVSITDTCPEDALGDPMYTNQGVGGIEAAVFPPPKPMTIESFRGHMFYGNITLPPSLSIRVPQFFGLIQPSASAQVRAGGIGRRDLTATSSSGSATLTGISAADLVGVAIGQTVNASTITFASPNPSVVAIGVSALTMSAQATNTVAAASLSLVDVIELNGSVYPLESAASLGAIISGQTLYATCINFGYNTLGFSGGTFTTQPLDYVYITGYSAGSAATLTVRASNGANYLPQLPNMTDTVQTISAAPQTNVVAWSENNQPERCPLANNLPVGRGEIHGMIATRDAMWIFASDGLWRLSGTGGSVGAEGYDWRVDPVDPTLRLAGPRAFTVLKDVVYAMTNRGFVAIDSAGTVNELTSARIVEILPEEDWSTPTFGFTNGWVVEADHSEDEIIIRANGQAQYTYTYSIRADAFTNDEPATISSAIQLSDALYSPESGGMFLLGYAPSNGALSIIRNSTSRAAMDLKYQPVYSENTFDMHRWQNVSVAYENTTASAVTITLGANSFGTIGSGTIAGNSTNESIYGRFTAGVPVAAPAASNNIAVSATTTSTGAGRLRLQGVTIEFETASAQRKNR